MQPQADVKKVRRVYIKTTDDAIWEMFARYVFVTAKQACEITGWEFRTIQHRLLRLTEGEYLGRVQVNEFTDFLYYLAPLGAKIAVQRGFLDKPWFVRTKSRNQIDHEKGITDFLIRAHHAFPGLRSRRWRADLCTLFKGEIPDAMIDFHDEKGWCPVEFVIANPVSEEKLRDYQEHFERAYIILPTPKALENFLAKIEEKLPTTKLWFTYAHTYQEGIADKIWWTPANFRERSYSILPPTT